MNDQQSVHPRDQSPQRPLPWLAVVLPVLVLGYAAWRLVPSAPLPMDAPTDRFSATRALATLRHLQPAPLPHPAGTEEQHHLHARLVAELEALGLKPQSQERYVCGRFGVCAPVVNVIAEIPGASPRGLVVAAHYDSVPAGPGTADDLAGVASALEIARALQHQQPLEHTVLLLFTDAEEVGLLGAQLFRQRHPAASRIDTAINLEARGTQGPSYAFRMSNDTRRLLGALRQVPRPLASSVQQEVFRHLPNGTDLAELMVGGIAGYDLAFIGGAFRYHTQLDSIEHLSPRSVQEQGANALALLRAVDRLGPAPPDPQPAVYFDVLRHAIVAWPQSASVPFAALLLAALLVVTGVLIRQQRVTLLGLAVGALAWTSSVVVAGFAAGASYMVAKYVGALPSLWVAHPGVWSLVAVAFAAATTLLAATLGTRVSAPELVLGSLGPWTLAGLLLAIWLPGACYLALVPALAGVAAALGWAAARDTSATAVSRVLELAPVTFAAVVWSPIALQLYAAVGFALLPLNVLACVLPASLWSGPLTVLPTKWLGRGLLSALGIGMAAFFLAILIPPANQRHPLWMTLAYQEHAGHEARWLLDATFASPPAALLDAVPFVQTHRHQWVGSFQRTYSAPAPLERQPSPSVIELARRSTPTFQLFRARLQPASSSVLSVHLPLERPLTVMVNDQPASPHPVGGYRAYVFLGVPRSGIEIEILVNDGAPLSGWVVEHHPGLPAAGTELAALRDRWGRPAHFGDTTLVSTRLDIRPDTR